MTSFYFTCFTVFQKILCFYVEKQNETLFFFYKNNSLDVNFKLVNNCIMTSTLNFTHF